MNINDNNDKHCDSDANPPRRSFLKKMAVGAALAGALTLGAGQAQAATTWAFSTAPP